MGKIDETLLYNGFNSYEFSDGDETLWNEIFNVALYSHISVQLVTIKLGGTATGKFIVRWIDEDKKKVGNDNEISFDVTNRWSRKTATLEVPENADTAMIAINGAYFHIACPMAEAGEIATAFDPSLASKMAWHDATGSYVGFLSANQIVAGILRSVTGDSGFDLELPRIWMKSNDGEVTWEATPDNPLAVKDKDGKMLTGLVKLDTGYALVAQRLTNDADMSDGYADVGVRKEEGDGEIPDSYNTTIDLYDKNGDPFPLRMVKFNIGAEGEVGTGGYIASSTDPNSSKTILTLHKNLAAIEWIDETDTTAIFPKETSMILKEGVLALGVAAAEDGIGGRTSGEISISEDGVTLSGAKGKPRVQVLNSGNFFIKNQYGYNIASFFNSGNIFIYNGDSNITANERIGVRTANGITAINPFLTNGSGDEIGVDALGPYYKKNGTKTYF